MGLDPKISIFVYLLNYNLQYARDMAKISPFKTIPLQQAYGVYERICSSIILSIFQASKQEAASNEHPISDRIVT